MFRTDEQDHTWLAPDDKPVGAGASTEPEKDSEEPTSDDGAEPETDLDVEGAEDADGQDATAPGVGPKKKGPPPGHPRWEQVYAGFKAAQRYSQYGSPEQIEQALRRLQRYDEQIEAHQRKGESSKETQELEAARGRIEAQLRQMFPWMERMDEVLTDHDARKEGLKSRAAEEVVAFMTEQGMEIEEESFNEISGVLGEVIQGNKRLYTIYKVNPERAVREAAEVLSRPFKATAERRKGAELIKSKEPHKALPKATAPRSAGGPAPKSAPTKEPQDIREAESLFLKGLSQLNKG